MESTGVLLSTQRLDLGPWTLDDAAAALPIYGNPDVARWLSPAVEPITDLEAMRTAVAHWAELDRDGEPPVGHWRVTRRSDGVVVGSVTLRRMPPVLEDLELAWQFAPEYWGNGYANEAAYAVARWAFDGDADELFAVTRPGNDRAIKLAQRLGMVWVGETEKYYGLRLQVFRVRPPELVRPTTAQLPRQSQTGSPLS